jgi:hypothetical protein
MTFTELTSVPGTPCAHTLSSSSKAGSSFGNSQAEQLQLASYEAGDAAEPAAKRRKAGQFKCPKCASWKQVSEADKTRPSTCVKCVNSYAGMQRRWASDRKLKVWFDAMDVDKKVEWYRKQADLPGGTKRKYAELNYKDVSTNRNFNKRSRDDLHITFSKWKLPFLIEGKTNSWCEKEFVRRVSDARYQAIYERHQWLLPEWEGVRNSNGQEMSQGYECARGSVPESSQHMNQMIAAGVTLREQFLKQTEVPTAPAENAPHIDLDPTETFHLPFPQDVIASAIGREVE